MAFPSLTLLDTFCSECQTLLIAFLRDEYGIFISGVEDWIMQHTLLDPCYRHHISFAGLQNASNNRCPICVQIFAKLESSLSVFASSDSSFWTVFRPRGGSVLVWFVDDRGAYGKIVDFKILKFNCNDSWSDMALRSNLVNVSQAFVIAESDEALRLKHISEASTATPMPEVLVKVRKEQWILPIAANNSLPTIAHPSSQTTEDDSIVKLAQEWLQNCIQGHGSTCSHESNYKPPRLLDLRSSSIKLILRQDLGGQDISYAALSHCWGRAPQRLLLTSDNITELLKDISTDDLPKTFQDAVSLCRKLSIPFLWLDWLCIVQKGKDHLADWQLHVSEMSPIYSKCVLCIAADSAADSREGLYHNRNASTFQSIAIDARAQQFSGGSETPRSTPATSDIDEAAANALLVMNISHMDNDLGDCPLSKRAWVYQERFLAPRVLHFGLQQVYYECLSGDFASECFPAGGKIVRLSALSERLGLFTFNPLIRPEEQWDEIVGAYSERLLTNSSDKLPAIAGVAREFAERNDLADYLAGFFHLRTLVPLLWRVSASDPRVPADFSELEPSHMYVAPSWSWAAATASIEFPDVTLNDSIQNHILASLESWELQLVDSSNIFGQLSYTSITVKAPFCNITFEPNAETEDQGSGDTHHHYTCTLDVAAGVTQSQPNPKYQFHPVLVWAQVYNQQFLETLLSKRSNDLSHSSRTVQVSERISIAFDGTILEYQPTYRVMWIRRRQVEHLFDVDIFHEGIILKEKRKRWSFHRKPSYTRIGHIGHRRTIKFEHEWDSLLTRGPDSEEGWSPISMADLEAPREKTKKFKLL